MNAWKIKIDFLLSPTLFYNLKKIHDFHSNRGIEIDEYGTATYLGDFQNGQKQECHNTNRNRLHTKSNQ